MKSQVLTTYSRSNVNTICMGRLLGPPTQEPRHMNWNRFVTHSDPAVKQENKVIIYKLFNTIHVFINLSYIYTGVSNVYQNKSRSYFLFSLC